jgi:hypothetical protein
MVKIIKGKIIKKADNKKGLIFTCQRIRIQVNKGNVCLYYGLDKKCCTGYRII